MVLFIVERVRDSFLIQLLREKFRTDNRLMNSVQVGSVLKDILDLMDGRWLMADG